MSWDAILHSPGASLEEFPQAERADRRKTKRAMARAKEKIVEYRNSCAIRGLPFALCRVLPLLNIGFRSRYPRLDESRTSGPAYPAHDRLGSREHRLPTPSSRRKRRSKSYRMWGRPRRWVYVGI